MSKSHNKKRNVGIIYEQLLRKVSSALIEKDQRTAETAIAILKDNFKPGTELYKEFRVFNALVKTRIRSETLACRILDEAKKAARDHHPAKLRAEKSALIKEINYKLSDCNFYRQRVKDYRSYATIQQLMNYWRSGENADLSRVTQYENNTVEWLLSDRDSVKLEEQKDSDVNALTVKIMTEKFNSKYGAVLNEQQRKIIQEYSLRDGTNSDTEFISYLSSTKKSTLAALQRYSLICENHTLNEKMRSVIEGIKAFDPNTVDDESLAKYLLLSKLGQELKEGGE